MGRLISTVVEPAETTIETGRQLLDRIIAERNKKLLEETKKNHTDLQIPTKPAGKRSDSRSKSQIRVTKKELPPITEDGKKSLFPLPPLAEQKRIVAAVEHMLPLCGMLGG